MTYNIFWKGEIKLIRNKNPNKFTLKNELYKDKERLMNAIIESEDDNETASYKIAYDLVNKYIDICKNRNRF